MRASNHTAATLLLIARWKRIAAARFARHPVSTVVSFDRLWPWLLTGMLIAETHHAAAVLQVCVEVSSN